MKKSQAETRREVLEYNAKRYGWCSCLNPERLLHESTFCTLCQRVIPEEKLPPIVEKKPVEKSQEKNPPPVDDYTLKLELLLTDLLSVLRAFTCRHCSGAGCDQCDNTGYHPFARRAIKRIEETLRKEWVDADGK